MSPKKLEEVSERKAKNDWIRDMIKRENKKKAKEKKAARERAQKEKDEKRALKLASRLARKSEEERKRQARAEKKLQRMEHLKKEVLAKRQERIERNRELEDAPAPASKAAPPKFTVRERVNIDEDPDELVCYGGRMVSRRTLGKNTKPIGRPFI